MRLNNTKIAQLFKDLQSIDSKFILQLRLWVLQNRIKTYLLFVLFVFRLVIPKIPYLNIVFILNKSMIDLTLISLSIILLAGFNGKRLFIIGALSLIPIAVLTVFRNGITVEQLANVVYVLFVIGAVSLFIEIRNNDEK